MTIEKKNKLIYSGELVFFAIAFFVIGLLELLKVIVLSDRFQLIFKILTLVGATWLVADFFWTLLNKKRRANNDLLDKIIMLPLAIYLYGYDSPGFVVARAYEYYQVGVPIAFFYITCSYLFQGIYHYYRPIPLIVQAIEEETKDQEQKAIEAEVINEENKEEPQIENEEHKEGEE